MELVDGVSRALGSSLRIKVEVAQRVAIVGLAGLLMASDLDGMNCHLCEYLSGYEVAFIVMNFRGAMAAFTELDLYAILAGHARPIHCLPIALIVCPESFKRYRRYARDVAAMGYVRGIFTDAAQAMEWARLKAQASYLAEYCQARPPVR